MEATEGWLLAHQQPAAIGRKKIRLSIMRQPSRLQKNTEIVRGMTNKA